jgi:hypothetical protein
MQTCSKHITQELSPACHIIALIHALNRLGVPPTSLNFWSAALYRRVGVHYVDVVLPLCVPDSIFRYNKLGIPCFDCWCLGISALRHTGDA